MLSAHPIGGLILLSLVSFSLAQGPAPIFLGAAGNFAILAKSGVSTVSNSAISGDVGVSPGKATSLKGFSLIQDPSKQFWTSTQVNGRVMSATDASPTPELLTIAVSDMQSAFTEGMNRKGAIVGVKNGRIGGSILTPALYKWTSAVTIATGITIVGGPADTWIFQVGGSLNLAANVQIELLGGALPQNLLWVVAGTVTINANSTFQGNILAKTDVDVETNAIDNGCIYTQKAVSLHQSTILCPRGGGQAPPTSSTTSSAASSTTSSAISSTTSSAASSTTSSAATATVTEQCTPTGAPTCFTTAFKNLNASIQGDDFLTFTLTDTAEECIDLCACTEGCVFANPNFDNAKNTTQLTCSLYAGCHTAADATNTGGQTLPDGSLSTVTNSSGFCMTPCARRRWY
ncbi:DUF3494 domain-containing protein [Mycena venus]|uniref:DUF3494 domain-containing protein n=1 Tax=Mycena venus TaxID=2733690 RepID=A0A8H7CZK4_9AGAR|nr:DUF3494 domain-containing protein [Mycena venus]